MHQNRQNAILFHETIPLTAQEIIYCNIKGIYFICNGINRNGVNYSLFLIMIIIRIAEFRFCKLSFPCIKKSKYSITIISESLDYHATEKSEILDRWEPYTLSSPF
jgi:hypothetical protein